MRAFCAVTAAVAWRSVRTAVLKPAILFSSLVFPLLSLFAFAGGLSTVSHVPGFGYRPGYTAFQYVFVLLQSAAFAGAFAGFALALDFETGFARRLLLSASRRSGIIAGYALGALLRWLLTGAVVTVAAVMAGMRVPGSEVDLLGLLWLALLTNLAACLWGTGVAMFLRTEQAGTLIQMPVMLILFLAPVYVPLHLLKGWVHAVATVNPATILLDAGRSLLAGRPLHIAGAFGVIAAAALLMLLWARRGLRSAASAG